MSETDPRPVGERVVAQARTYLDVPFYHAGRNRAGLDCIGLLAVVCHDLGLTDEEFVNYAPDPEPRLLTEALERHCRRVWLRERRKLQGRGDPSEDLWKWRACAGDFLQFEIGGDPVHAGIFARDERGRPTVIHCYQSAGKVVEHPFDVHWERRLWAVWRWNG